LNGFFVLEIFSMWHLLALSAAVLLNASANLFLKFGMKAIKAHPALAGEGPLHTIKSMVTSPLILLGLIFFALNVPLYAYALGKFKVSLAYPIMTGCGFAMIVLVAGFSGLQERLDTFQWLGVGLILAGVVLVGSRLQN
jgi:multidrug transporter EmrE-like cation transporter